MSLTAANGALIAPEVEAKVSPEGGGAAELTVSTKLVLLAIWPSLTWSVMVAVPD